MTGLSAPSFAQTSGVRLGCRSVSARSADTTVAAGTSTELTPPMRSAKRFVKRIRGIEQWAVPGETDDDGQVVAISSISLSNTAQTRSLSCEKHSRGTNGGAHTVGL